VYISDVLEPHVPIRRVLKVDIFDEDVPRVVHVKQTRPVFRVDQIIDGTPPSLAVSVDQTFEHWAIGRGERDSVDFFEIHAFHDAAIVSWPCFPVIGVGDSAVDLDGDIGQVGTVNTTDQNTLFGGTSKVSPGAKIDSVLLNTPVLEIQVSNDRLFGIAPRSSML